MTNTASAAEWIGGIGSIAGTLVVGGGLLWEIHQRRRADAAEAAARKDAEAADARLVSTLWTIYPKVSTVLVRNDSDSPIRSFAFGLRTLTMGEVQWATRVLPQAFIIGAHDEQEVRAHFDPPLTEADRVNADDLETLIEFTDARGLRWRITNEDQPERVVI